VRGADRLIGLYNSSREDANLEMHQMHIRHVINTPAFWGEVTGNSTLGSKEDYRFSHIMTFSRKKNAASAYVGPITADDHGRYLEATRNFKTTSSESSHCLFCLYFDSPRIH